MSNTQRSSSDIERDVEKKRSEVDKIIGEIKDRLSPQAATDYGMSYMRGPGGQRLLGAVRDNPLAAVLALGGLGWLFYTASQPEEERRRARARRGGFIERDEYERFGPDRTDYRPSPLYADEVAGSHAAARPRDTAFGEAQASASGAPTLGQGARTSSPGGAAGTSSPGAFDATATKSSGVVGSTAGSIGGTGANSPGSGPAVGGASTGRTTSADPAKPLDPRKDRIP